MRVRVKRAALAVACVLAPGLVFAQATGAVGVPDFNIASAIPNALFYSNGTHATVQAFVQVNPNNQSPCLVGNTGCPSLGNGAGGGGLNYSGSTHTTPTISAPGTYIAIAGGNRDCQVYNPIGGDYIQWYFATSAGSPPSTMDVTPPGGHVYCHFPSGVINTATLYITTLTATNQTLSVYTAP
jgi:hypothetical protein